MNAGGSAINTTLVAVLASKDNKKNIVTQEKSNVIKDETIPLLDENINSINNFSKETNTKNKCCLLCTIL